MRWLTLPGPVPRSTVSTDESKAANVRFNGQQTNQSFHFHIERSSPMPLFASIAQSRMPNVVADLARSDDGSSFRVHKIVGDGRCMFRATVRSLAMHKGVFLRSRDELEEAEQLRQACHDALCRTSQRSKDFPDARKQILYGYGDIRQYCTQLARPTFWGGEVEMMVIAKMLKIPIYVYTATDEKVPGTPQNFKITAKFGEKYGSTRRTHVARKPVHLLYTGGNHFDLLLEA